MVVPRSAKQITDDVEFVLYAVVVLKQAVQEFTAKARDKRWTVRDFTFEPNKVQEDAAKKKLDEAEEARLKLLLSKWCGTSCGPGSSILTVAILTFHTATHNVRRLCFNLWLYLLWLHLPRPFLPRLDFLWLYLLGAT